MKKTIKIIANVLLWIFVVFAVFVTILVFSSQQNDTGLPSFLGKSMVNILSDSMKPTFNKGDLIVVNPISVEESHKLKKGDIITYYVDLNKDGNDEMNTHRIISTYEKDGYTYYVTKGDHNSAKDLPVVSNKVIGIYSGTDLGNIGGFLNFLRSQTGFLCVIVLPLVLFFLFELYNFISVVIKVKNKNNLSKEDEDKIKQEAIEEYLRRQNVEAATEENKAEEAPVAAEKTDDK